MGRKTEKDGVSFILILVILFIVFWIFSGSFMYSTSPNEYKLIRQFGDIVKITSEPGIGFKLPIIQSQSSIPKNIRLYDLPSSDVITSDKKTMIVNSYVLWRVTDPKKFVQTLSASISNTEGRIDTIVYNATKNTISNMTQEEVIQSRDGKINVVNANTNEDLELKDVSTIETNEYVEISSLSERILENIGNSCEQYGIEIISVDVKMLDLPDSNKDAVYARMISERENIAAAYAAQGESEAKKIRNETDKEVSIMLSEAEAKAEQLEAEGEAEYMRILSEAYNDESKADFYTFVRSLDSLKESMRGQNKTVILSNDSPIAEIFNGNY